MFAAIAIGLALLSGSLAINVAPTRSTTDATITPSPQIELLRRQNDARDIGWLLWSSTWQFESCQSGATYFETSSDWRCCPTSIDGCASTDIPVSCVSGSLVYPYTGTGSASEITYAWYVSMFTEENIGSNVTDLQQCFGLHTG